MAAPRAHLPITQLFVESLVSAMGATLLHSAACVLNDICDVEFDRQVGEYHTPASARRTNLRHRERTRHRPLAANRVSIGGAWTLLTVMTLGCVWFLTLANGTA